MTRRDRYADVYNLVTHSSHLDQEDLFQYAVTAALLTTYLERRTSFFEMEGNFESFQALNDNASINF